jgi:hypothetical protein
MWEMDKLRKLAIERISNLPITMEEWIAVLKISTSWDVSEIRETAIQRLSTFKFDPVDKVLLATEYKVSQWLLEGYTELVMRPATLSDQDEKRLGFKAASKLYRIREKRLRDHIDNYVSSYHSLNPPGSENSVMLIIRKDFKKELAKASTDGQHQSQG